MTTGEPAAASRLAATACTRRRRRRRQRRQNLEFSVSWCRHTAALLQFRQYSLHLQTRRGVRLFVVILVSCKCAVRVTQTHCRAVVASPSRRRLHSGGGGGGGSGGVATGRRPGQTNNVAAVGDAPAPAPAAAAAACRRRWARHNFRRWPQEDGAGGTVGRRQQCAVARRVRMLGGALKVPCARGAVGPCVGSRLGFALEHRDALSQRSIVALHIGWRPSRQLYSQLQSLECSVQA